MTKNVQVNLSNEMEETASIKRHIKKVVAVGSGKGGVGKSTVAVNLAVTLAKKGFKVGLLDADIYGPNIPMMMGVEEQPEIKGEKLIPPTAYGVKLMSIGFLVQSGQPLIWRGPLLHKTLQQFLNDVEWGELDYLIVDFPPGTGDAQLSVAQSVEIDGGIIVTLPQQVSVEDAHRAISMFGQLKTPIIGIVENMSYLTLPDGSNVEVFGNGGGESLAELTNSTFLGKIPMETEVRSGGDHGKPISIEVPDSKASLMFTEISEKMENYFTS